MADGSGSSALEPRWRSAVTRPSRPRWRCPNGTASVPAGSSPRRPGHRRTSTPTPTVCEPPAHHPAGIRPAPTAAASAAALAALRWSADELDPTYPVHVAHAGNDHLVLGLAQLETLAQFDYDLEGSGVLMEREGWTTVHAFVHDEPGRLQRPRRVPARWGARGPGDRSRGGGVRRLPAPPGSARPAGPHHGPTRGRARHPQPDRDRGPAARSADPGLGSRHPAGAVAVRRAGAPVKRPQVDGPSSGGQ